jgi:hypothetical protein
LSPSNHNRGREKEKIEGVKGLLGFYIHSMIQSSGTILIEIVGEIVWSLKCNFFSTCITVYDGGRFYVVVALYYSDLLKGITCLEFMGVQVVDSH